MRVLFLSDFFFPMIGGIEVRALQFIKAMRRRGHEFLVLTSRDPLGGVPAESDYEGLRVVRFPLISAIRNRDLQGIIRQRRDISMLKRSFAPQLVHAFISGPMIMAHLDTSATMPVPFLASVTSWIDGESGPNTLAGRALRSADWVTANSRRLLETIQARVPEILRRSSVVYSGNIWPDLQPEPLDFDRPVLLCIGRLIEEKGFDLAIRAMPLIVRHFPHARLIIAGDGPCRSSLVALASELDVSDCVEIGGWVEPGEILFLINRVTILLVPSRWEEAFASVAIQAAQMGRPVVAAEGGGMAEAVLHQVTGLIVPKENVHAIAESVMTLLADRAMAEVLGDKARERARKFFSWDRYLDEFEELYSRVVAQGGHQGVDAPKQQ